DMGDGVDKRLGVIGGDEAVAQKSPHDLLGDIPDLIPRQPHLEPRPAARRPPEGFKANTAARAAQKRDAGREEGNSVSVADVSRGVRVRQCLDARLAARAVARARFVTLVLRDVLLETFLRLAF